MVLLICLGIMERNRKEVRNCPKRSALEIMHRVQELVCPEITRWQGNSCAPKSRGGKENIP